jgi:ABC-type nitrate/sulfonate/bicarbonate transport system substrate-binding protein
MEDLPCSIAAAHFKLASPPSARSPPPRACARAQPKPRVKIRYNEVVRSILYTPAYVAMEKGFFEEAGFDITLATAYGGDKSMAALISDAADIALMGPEAPRRHDLRPLSCESKAKVQAIMDRVNPP